MKRVIFWTTSVAIAMTLAAPSASAQCRAADSTSARILHKWRSLMVATDFSTQQALSRNSIPRVDSSTVVLVTDKNTCSKAMKAYNTVLGAGAQPPSSSVYVIKVGTAYIVRDSVQRGGSYAADVVLDSGFRVKSQLLG